MPLVDPSLDGWKFNRTNIGPPYRVETIKYGQQYRYMRESRPQVCDSSGSVAISGPDGAVFCASRAQADTLCALANAGKLEKV